MSVRQGVLHDAGVISANDTAVVIDSTADLPDYADRFANLRMVPLTVRFGDEQDLRDHVDLDADAFYARLALVERAAAHVGAGPAGVRRLLPGAARRAVQPRRLGAHLGEALGHGAVGPARRRDA